MHTDRILIWLQRLHYLTPCTLDELLSTKHAFAALPTHAPDGRPPGPPPMPGQQKYGSTTPTRRQANVVFAIKTQANDQDEYELRYLERLRLVFVRRTPRKGSFDAVAPENTYGPVYLGLTPKGDEFLTLAADRKRLEICKIALRSREAYTFENLLRELRLQTRRNGERSRKG